MTSIGIFGNTNIKSENDTSDTNELLRRAIFEVQAIMIENDREQLNMDVFIRKIADELKYSKEQQGNLDYTEMILKFKLMDKATKTKIVAESTSESIMSRIENNMKELAEQVNKEHYTTLKQVGTSFNSNSRATKKKYKKKHKKH